MWVQIWRVRLLNAHLLVDDVGPDLEGSTAGEGRDVVDMVLSGKNTYIKYEHERQDWHRESHKAELVKH